MLCPLLLVRLTPYIVAVLKKWKSETVCLHTALSCDRQVLHPGRPGTTGLCLHYPVQWENLLRLYTQVISLTAYLDPLSVGLIVTILHLQTEFEEILCPPLVSVQTVSHDLGCRTVIFHTSFRTWQLLIPTSPLHDHSRYLPTPKTETETSCKTCAISDMMVSVYLTHLYTNVFPRLCFHSMLRGCPGPGSIHATAVPTHAPELAQIPGITRTVLLKAKSKVKNDLLKIIRAVFSPFLCPLPSHG